MGITARGAEADRRRALYQVFAFVDRKGTGRVKKAALLACVALGYGFCALAVESAYVCLVALAGVAALLGVSLVMAVGGADMPVIVSFLNSLSGWSCVGGGLLLRNELLVVTGALVGSSGAILSYVMCRAGCSITTLSR